MAKIVSDDVLDAALAEIATSTKMTACATQPTTYTEAVTDNMLAEVTLVAGLDDTGFSAAADDGTGRKVTILQKATVEIINTGTADHIALVDVTNTSLQYVTTCTNQALTDGGNVTFPAWDISIAGPT